MKKLFALLPLLVGFLSYNVHAQGYVELNKTLHRLEQENKINHDTEKHYDLEGKKFIFLNDFPEKTERWILEIKDGNSRLIALEDDKTTGKTTSKIYTGDVVRKKHVVSIRMDKMENERLSIPLTYLYHITYQKGIWYMIDANTGYRWIDTQDLGKKINAPNDNPKEKRKQRRKKKNRD